MNLDSAIVLFAIFVVPSLVWVANNWVRARHGYPIEDEEGKLTHRADTAEAIALREENQRLQAKLEQFERRMQVLESIVTDKGFDVAQQIEALRDARTVDNRMIEADSREKVQ